MNVRFELTIPETLNPGGVRVRLAGTRERPLFCIPDTCDVLEIRNIGNVVARLKASEVTKIRTADLGLKGGGHPIPFASESGFYKIVFQSRKAIAEDFADWVCGDVLPTIRRHGCWPAPQSTVATLAPYTNRVLAASAVEALLPPDYWCVFKEVSPLLISVEQVFAPAGLAMDHDDLLDGSVGQHWGKFRVGQPWEREPRDYPLPWPAPSNRRFVPIRPRCYHDDELVPFRNWLRGDYVGRHFTDYVRRKYDEEGLTAALPHIAKAPPAALPARQLELAEA